MTFAPFKSHDFTVKDILQNFSLARFLFGEVIPFCRESGLGI